MRNTSSSGFTLVEIMVAMVVLAIGLLGMAAMTVMVMRGSKGASDLTSATNICQLKIEELKDVEFSDLGEKEDGVDTDDELIQFGSKFGKMIEEAGLNAQGKTKQDLIDEGLSADEADDQGPFKFRRTFVICKSSDFDDSTETYNYSIGPVSLPAVDEPRAAPDCRVNPILENTRVQSLMCEPNDIALGYGLDSEKKIKVLCTWTDRTGQCHSVHLDTTVVDLN